MSEAIVKVLAQSDVRERLTSLGFEPVGGSPAALGMLVSREVSKWADVARRAGVKAE